MPPSPTLSAATRRAVLRAIREGSLSKAGKILLNPGNLGGPEAADELWRLHPEAAPPRLTVLEPFAMEDFDASEVVRALHSFLPGSGGGPSKLMTAHLPIGPSAEEVHVHQVLARFCSALAFG